MFWMRNEENSFTIGTLIWRPVSVSADKDIVASIRCVTNSFHLVTSGLLTSFNDMKMFLCT